MGSASPSEAAAAAGAGPDYNVIDVEVHNKALLNITREMAITLLRTSGSPVVREAKDFSVCLLDRDVEQLAFSGWVSFHIATAELGTRAVLERTPVTEMREGDAFLCNDPHTSGAIHQGDVGIVMPYFLDGELLGFGYVNEHLWDVGGSGVSGFAPEARDCFSEALQFSGIRFAGGEGIDPEWEAFIGNNVRLPGPVLNDIRSMLAALKVGRSRLAQLYAEAGRERYLRFNSIAKSLSEKAMRERISKLPDGCYQSETWIEYDARGTEEYHHLDCTLVLDGDEMTFHYRGDPQVDCCINGARPAVIGQTWTTLLCQLAYDIPVNAGISRPVHFDLGPRGTIVNSEKPAPVSMSHMECGFRINRLVNDVLSQSCSFSSDEMLRGRVAADPAQSVSYMVTSGTDRRSGDPVIAFLVSSACLSGGGAQTIHDGLDTYSTQCSTGQDIPDVEIDESTQPGMLLWRRIVPNTGGPGAFRGGLGIESALAILHSDRLSGLGITLFPTLPARGVAGGYPGAGGTWYALRDTNALELLESGSAPSVDSITGEVTPAPAKTGSLTLVRGDVFVALNGGGGGLGDPLTRPPELVRADLEDGYVTAAHARAVYGVVFSGDEVDEEATERLRAEVRDRRSTARSARPADGSDLVGSAIAIEDGAWSCRACGTRIGDARSNWREAVVSSERRIEDRFGELEMFVRGRGEGARPILRELSCPACGSSLATDVTREGTELPPAPRRSAAPAA
jgi:N-methylhydantoinase B